MAAETRTCFRLNAKNLFLTYPRCAVLPHIALGKFRQLFGSKVAWVIVAQELHSDPHMSVQTHLHIVSHLHTRCDIKGFKKLDSLCGMHGNYQRCRNVVKTVRYVIKDGKYRCFGIDPVLWLQENERKRRPTSSSQSVTKRLKAGATPADIEDEFPSFALLHWRHISEAYVRYVTRATSCVLKPLTRLLTCVGETREKLLALSSVSSELCQDSLDLLGWIQGNHLT